MTIEKMTRGRTEIEKYKNFMTAWRRAGYPQHFKWDGTKQVLDKKAMEERRADLEHPERKQARIQRGELEYRRRVQALFYR